MRHWYIILALCVLQACEVDMGKQPAFIESDQPTSNLAVELCKEGTANPIVAGGTYDVKVPAAYRSSGDPTKMVLSTDGGIPYRKVCRWDKTTFFLHGLPVDPYLLTTATPTQSNWNREADTVIGGGGGTWGAVVDDVKTFRTGIYPAPVPLGITIIPAGNWEFDFWMSSIDPATTGDSRLIYNIYAYHLDGSRTLLFSAEGTPISGYQPGSVHVKDVVYQDQFDLVPSDCLELQIGFQTNDDVNAWIAYWFGDSGEDSVVNESFITIPGALWVGLGDLPLTIASITDSDSPYTATPPTRIFADASGGNIEVDLPAASSVGSAELIVVKTDSSANTVTLIPQSGELINGETSYELPYQNALVELITDGTNWYQR